MALIVLFGDKLRQGIHVHVAGAVNVETPIPCQLALVAKHGFL